MTEASRINKGMYWQRAWSLISGCTHVSPGCDNCWSAKETHMRANNPNEKVKARNAGLTEKGCFSGKIRLNHEFFDLPLRVKKPTVFSVWNDLFHKDVPDEFIARVWWVMGQSAGYLDLSRYRGHTFLILTKRPNRMKKWLKGWADQETRKRWIESFGEVYDCMNGPKYWPTKLDSVWLGVTAENQEMADKRIPILLQVPAAVRFVSVEPMLGPVDLREWTADCGCVDCQKKYFTDLDELILTEDDNAKCPECDGEIVSFSSYCSDPGINWVICGGESGPGARPCHPDWARSLRNQCQTTGTKFFFKQWGEFKEICRYNTWPKYADHAGRVSRAIGPVKSGRVALLNTDGSDLVNGGPEYKVYPISHLERVGKNNAGRILDGRTWSEFPIV